MLNNTLNYTKWSLMTQYHNKNYLTFERLQAYLEQYKLIEGGSDSSILEIGKGAGFFENLVNSIGYHYVSIDYDNEIGRASCRERV